MRSRIAFYTNPNPNITNYYQLIDYAVERNISSIEGFAHLGLEKPDTEEARRIREYADKKGVTFCCFSVGAVVAGDNRRNEIERVKRFVDVAHVLGSPFIHHTITPGYTPAEHTPGEVENIFNEAIASLREIYDYAAPLGIRAVYEEQSLLFNGIKGFERLFEAIDRDIGVVADLGNIYQLNETICPFIERFRDKIVHVHVKDIGYFDEATAYRAFNGRYMRELTELGTGVVDLTGALRLLKQYGYNGQFSIECWSRTENDALVEANIDRICQWLA